MHNSSVQLIFNHFLGGPILAFISCWADATQGQTHHKSLTLIECQLDTKVRLVRWLAFQTCQLKDPGSMPAKRIRQQTDLLSRTIRPNTMTHICHIWLGFFEMRKGKNGQLRKRERKRERETKTMSVCAFSPLINPAAINKSTVKEPPSPLFCPPPQPAIFLTANLAWLSFAVNHEPRNLTALFSVASTSTCGSSVCGCSRGRGGTPTERRFCCRCHRRKIAVTFA